MLLSREQMEKLLQKWYQAWNDHDLEKVLKVFHDDVVFENWDGGKVKGKKALRRAWKSWFENHGGFLFSEEETFIDEALQKVLFRWQLEWPATEKRFEGKKEIRHGVDLLYFKEGKIIIKTTFLKTYVEIHDKKMLLAIPPEERP